MKKRSLFALAVLRIQCAYRTYRTRMHLRLLLEASRRGGVLRVSSSPPLPAAVEEAHLPMPVAIQAVEQATPEAGADTHRRASEGLKVPFALPGESIACARRRECLQVQRSLSSVS